MSKCLICLKKEVAPMNEVDVGIGTVTSTEPPICEDCYEMRPDEVDKLLAEWGDPFKLDMGET